MDRKDFIRKGILGTSILVTSSAAAKVIQDNFTEGDDELKALDIIGFNHIPNTSSQLMASTVLHKANSRGHADHGWLKSYHSFSFANYYNPERMHFGVLRVLNDDTVEAGMGFGRHPHDNMEIISIPLDGDLEHKDSMGNTAVIKNGDIQVMSAGTGIFHSEYNKNANRNVKFLQIWLFPKSRNVKPRYDQITLDIRARKNKLQQILSPNPDDDGVWIHQDAWFHLGHFDKHQKCEYLIKKPGNGVYVFMIKGEATVSGVKLNQRDGLGIWDTKKLDITADNETEILLMDVPMSM